MRWRAAASILAALRMRELMEIIGENWLKYSLLSLIHRIATPNDVTFSTTKLMVFPAIVYFIFAHAVKEEGGFRRDIAKGLTTEGNEGESAWTWWTRGNRSLNLLRWQKYFQWTHSSGKGS